MYNSFITLHKVKKQTIRYLLKNARGPKFFLNVCTQLWQVPTDEQTSVPEAIMKRNHHLILPLEKKKDYTASLLTASFSMLTKIYNIHFNSLHQSKWFLLFKKVNILFF